MTDDLPTFTHDTRRIVSCNAAAAALFRCALVALLDVDMLELIVNAEWRQLAALRLRVMRSGEKIPGDIKYKFRRCDGSIFWASPVTKKICDDLFETVLNYEGEEE